MSLPSMCTLTVLACLVSQALGNSVVFNSQKLPPTSGGNLPQPVSNNQNPPSKAGGLPKPSSFSFNVGPQQNNGVPSGVGKKVMFGVPGTGTGPEVSPKHKNVLDLDSSYINSIIGSRSPHQYCNCISHHYCQPPPDGSGQIDIRIVTDLPSGVTCGTGLVYCCYNSHHPTTTTSPPWTTSWTTPWTTTLPSPTCGTRNIIPVNGISPAYGQSSFGEYPWTALVLGQGNDYVGGGVLISSTHVLTAAHRVHSYPNGAGLKVRLGEWNAARDTEPYAFQEYSISRLDVHPYFNSTNLHNDVALITLASAVPLHSSPHINAACLTSSVVNITGHRCWVSGWGKDAFGASGVYQEIMKAVDVVVMDQNACESAMRSTRLGSYFQLDRTSFVCAGGEHSKDACTGDGGSPLVCDINGFYHVIGLVAWGIGCANTGIPGIYVHVQAYQQWIAQHMSY